MYQKLLIDSALEYRVTEDIKNIFLNNGINFEFCENNTGIKQNTLYLTADKNNLSENLVNVFLLQTDYDFLDVKDAIFIKKIEDIVKVYEDSVWKNWAQELQFLAQCSLAYSKDKFDRERSKRIREISCEMLAYKYNISPEKVEINFAGEIGYQTPKVENRGAIIKDNKILLVKEKIDGKWALPGGYQDVNRSVRENIIKEASEEAGAVVNPNKIIAVFDYNRHHNVNFPYGMVKIFVLCEYIDHYFRDNTETLDAKFFSLDNLPELSSNRTTIDQIKMCFDCYNNIEDWETIFD